MIKTVIPDLRDQRGRENPGRWQPQGAPRTENERPASGKIPADRYHDKAPLSSPSPEGRPMKIK